jgi:hypothetical protein
MESTTCQKSEKGCPYVGNSVRPDRTCIHAYPVCAIIVRSTSHCSCSHDGSVASCVAYACWFTLALAHKIFVPLSTLLSDLCLIVVQVIYGLECRSSRAHKNPIVLLLLALMRGSRVGCIRITDCSAFTKGQVQPLGTIIRCIPARLALFSSEKASHSSLSCNHQPPLIKDGRSLG